MTKRIYVTTAQVLAAKMVLDLHREDDEPMKDEDAIRAIANAQPEPESEAEAEEYEQLAIASPLVSALEKIAYEMRTANMIAAAKIFGGITDTDEVEARLRDEEPT